jgi:hypothetical protein
MDDWTPEMDEAFNEIEKQSNLGKQILQEIKPQREWVGLTDEEFEYCVKLKNPVAIVEEVEAKLRSKNT